ncbi:MAG: leucine-rich repeat domain-containing protein [Alistipes sp.]|nr:leucine-rich repeat domain-containing protein [Alistipes sp.]
MVNYHLMIGVQSSDKNSEPVNKISFVGKTMMKLLSCLVLFGLLSVGCSTNDSDENDDFGNYGEGNPDNIIQFKDWVAEDICVKLWDTNGDRKFSYREAAAVKSIGLNFHNSDIQSLGELHWFTGLTSIPDFAFEGCHSLTLIAIPENVTSIGECAFAGCSRLTMMDIPDSITSIGESAFSNCRSLKWILIPSSVTSIGYCAFDDCSFEHVYCKPATPPIVSGPLFTHCYPIIYVPIASVDAYRNSWSYWQNYIVGYDFND